MKKWIKIGIGVLLVAMWMERGRASEDCGPCMEPNDATITMGGGSNCIPSAAGTAVPSEPCKECDGAGGVTNKPDSDTCCAGGTFDPDTEGCCQDPVTGQSTKTSNPENAKPEDICQDAQQLPDASGAYGATVCYNGKKMTCVFPLPAGYDPSLEACVQAHEDVHLNDSNFTCSGCDLEISEAQGQAGIDGECTALQAGLDCLNNAGFVTGALPMAEKTVSKMCSLNCSQTQGSCP